MQKSARYSGIHGNLTFPARQRTGKQLLEQLIARSMNVIRCVITLNPAPISACPNIGQFVK
jgi:hypothetical protein